MGRQEDAEAMIAKPNFHSSVFSKNLVAIELRKQFNFTRSEVWYTWICASSIYSRHIYNDFHHEYFTPLFHVKCKIMYIDTDSFIECDDVYDIMKRDIITIDLTRAITRVKTRTAFRS